MGHTVAQQNTMRQVAQLLNLPADPDDYGWESAVWFTKKQVIMLHNGTDFKPGLLHRMGVVSSYTLIQDVWVLYVRRLEDTSTNDKLHQRALKIDEAIRQHGSRNVETVLSDLRFSELRVLYEWVREYGSSRLVFDLGAYNWMLDGSKLLPVDIIADRAGIRYQ